MTFKIALYKGHGNLFNKLIRFWDQGKYSHCELVFSDGKSASATFRDGRQVREKEIVFDDANWDFINLPAELEPAANEFLQQTRGMPYDLVGQSRFMFAPWHGVKKSYWCSEWCAAALGMSEPWRYGPNNLAIVLWYKYNG
jgi:hypothetical protein